MEFLPDPINYRPMKDLPSFVNKEIEDSLLFPKPDIPDWKIFEEFMSREGPM